MDVSIILVNYNTREMTKKCIDSVYEHTSKLSFEIILVDNDSHDGSQEVFSKDKRIIFLESGSNLGFGRANNLGLKYAKGKYVFFLNTDTLLKNNAIEQFFEFAESHQDEKIGAIGCPLVDANGNPSFSCGHFLKVKMIFLTLTQHFGHVPDIYGKNKQILGDSDKVANVDYVSGANIFVRKEVVDKYGAFDADFFMYYEETEMQHRWKSNGYGSKLLRGPEIVHLEGGSFKKPPKNNRKAYSRKLLVNRRSEMLFFKKSYSMLYYLLYRVCFFLYVLNDFLSRRDWKFLRDEWKLACTGNFE